MAKKATKTIDLDKQTVEFKFPEPVSKSIVVEFAKLANPMKLRSALHGISQRIGDSYAGAKSVQEAYDSAKSVFDELVAGNWSAPRSAGGPRTTLLAEALVRVTKGNKKLPTLTLEQAIEVVSEADDDTKKGLRNSPDIKKAIAQIQLERAEAEQAQEGQKSLEELLAG